MTQVPPLSSELTLRIHQAIAQAGGWIGFDRFMAMALYEPGLGYYTNALQKFGAMPSSGSDFVTAPGMSPLFGQTLAVQVKEALAATGADEVWEFGAGTGALALQLLGSLGDAVARINRYRPGLVVVKGDTLSAVRISAVMRLDNLDDALKHLAQQAHGRILDLPGLTLIY